MNLPSYLASYKVVTMEPLNPLTLGQHALKVTAEIHHNSGLYWPWKLEG